MLSDILGFFLKSWQAVYGWFVSLTDSMGAWVYISGVFFAMLGVRFLLAPALQAGVSDGVTMSRDYFTAYKSRSSRSVRVNKSGPTQYLGGRYGG